MTDALLWPLWILRCALCNINSVVIPKCYYLSVVWEYTLVILNEITVFVFSTRLRNWINTVNGVLRSYSNFNFDLCWYSYNTRKQCIWFCSWAIFVLSPPWEKVYRFSNLSTCMIMHNKCSAVKLYSEKNKSFAFNHFLRVSDNYSFFLDSLWWTTGLNHINKTGT